MVQGHLSQGLRDISAHMTWPLGPFIQHFIVFHTHVHTFSDSLLFARQGVQRRMVLVVNFFEFLK